MFEMARALIFTLVLGPNCKLFQCEQSIAKAMENLHGFCIWTGTQAEYCDFDYTVRLLNYCEPVSTWECRDWSEND